MKKLARGPQPGRSVPSSVPLRSSFWPRPPRPCDARATTGAQLPVLLAAATALGLLAGAAGCAKAPMKATGPGWTAGGDPDNPDCTPSPLDQSGTLRGQYGTATVTAGGQEYFLQVNEWNSTSPQTMSYGGDAHFRMTQQDGSASTSGGPTGFPSMFIGANANHSTRGSNLPKAVSALTQVPTTWTWDDNGGADDTSANSFNAAYDVWFSTQAAGEPSAYGPSGGYLMVWLYDPPDAQPIGSVRYSNVTIPGVSGTWDVWIGPNGTRPCISYVRRQFTKSLAFDLNAFIQDAVTNRPDTIQSGWYLTNIFTGFEIWRGGVGLETTGFCAMVN